MNGHIRAFAVRSMVVVAYAIAMGYLESAVVVYLRGALSIDPTNIFPLEPAKATNGLAAIEFGREGATLVMLATVGWLAGARPLERLAWCAVAFGVWDIAYYAWLWVFVGWPPTIDTWDLLFLIPVPWTAPVWAPCLVSTALIGFGLAAAWVSEAGGVLRVSRMQAALAIAGGLLVILSFTIDAPRIIAQAMPRDYAWPIFITGMALAVAAGVGSLRGGATGSARAGTREEAGSLAPARREARTAR